MVANEKELEKIPVKRKFKPAKVLYPTGTLLLVILLFFTFQAFTHVAQVEETLYHNTIEQKTTYDYQVDVHPSTLYPFGGLIKPNSIIFTNITKGIKVKANSFIKAQNPVSLQGKYKIVLIVTAEGLWERYNRTLEFTHVLDGRGQEIPLFNDEVYIPLQDVLRFIDRIEKETELSSSEYYLKIRPEYDGYIYDNQTKIPFDSASEFVFKLGNRQLELTSDREFSTTNPVKSSRLTKIPFRILNMEIPLNAAKVVLSIVDLLLLIVLAYMPIKRLLSKKSEVSESDKIDRKYRNRLIRLRQQIEFSSQHTLAVEDFKSLLHIADEKELPILRLEGPDGNILYQIVDGSCVYSYCSDNNSASQGESALADKSMFYA